LAFATPVTFVCGPPGSGKTTFVLTNRQEGDVVVDVDSLASAMLGGDTDKSDAAIPFVLAARDGIMQRLHDVSRLRMAWVISTDDSLRDRMRTDGASVVVIDTPAKVCKQRVLDRSAVDTSDVYAAIDRWFRCYAPHPSDEVVRGY